jgi:DNA-binding MarR family transcriptional regulator
MTPSHRQHFQRLMAEHGITETHGVDVLRMISMLANVYDVIVQAHMREENLSAPRWRLLLHLYAAELRGEAAVSPTQLSRFQNVTKNTVSSLLRSLEEDGLIERELDRRDRRQFHIRLSASGRELIRSSTPGHVAYLNHLVSDLSPTEIDQMQALLDKLHASLIHHGNLPGTYGAVGE